MIKIRKAVVRLGLIGVALVGVSATLVAMPADRTAVGAFKWVQALEPEEKGFYLQDSVLRALPLEYRHALVGSLLREERAAFWKGALSSFRSRRALTQEQLAVLSRAIESATPQFFDGTDRSTSVWTALEIELRRAFGSDGADEILYISKTSGGRIRLPMGERIAYEWRELRSRLALRADEANCNCMHNSHCGSNEECKDVECTPTPGPPCGGAGMTCYRYCVPVPQ